MRLLSALLASTFAIGAGEAAAQIQLLPAGEFAARDGRPGPGRSWNVTDEQGALLASDFTATAAKTPVVVDYDHQTLYVEKHGQKAPAAGWMSAAEWRPGVGLFATVTWTPAATQHITDGEYRFISPVLMYEPDTLRIRGVALAALVNYPALLGMSPVLAQLATQFQQEKDPMNPILAALLAALKLAETATKEEALSALAALTAKPAVPAIPVALAAALKLQAGADEAAALAAVAALNKPDTNGLAAMAALQAEVATLRTQVNGDKLNALVDGAIAEGKLIPGQRPWAIDLGTKDMAALASFLCTAPVMSLNGQTGNKERGGAANQDVALAGTLIAGFGLTAEQFAKAAPKAA